jgi:hopanoid biosynthesis associated RND transporter like protein HpnN
MITERLLIPLAGLGRRRPWIVLLGFLLLGLAAIGTSAVRLGVSTDTAKLFADTLPWVQREAAFARDFPQFNDLLVMVIDGATPEIADETAAGLAAALAQDSTHLRGVRRPDASPFLEANGLLFLDKPALAEVLDQTIDAQPFIGQLAADPSARGLFAALALLGLGVESGQADLAPYAPALAAFHAALEQAAAGRAVPLSWQRLLGGALSDLAGPYRIVLANPVLDHGALEPGAVAADAVRAAAAGLEFVRSGQARVRITGPVALADEEFATVAQGAVEGMIVSLLLVTLWLVLALRSWRVILPVLVTLGFGLVLTTGFAALAVGTLNLISVAFAVLFVGIAVDFGIQYGARFRDPAHPAAQTPRLVGPQILVAATAAAAGFLAFVPTDFRGVAELGLIAGGGMLIAFFCTIALLPALLTLTRAQQGGAEAGLPGGDAAERLLLRLRLPVLALFAALGLTGAVLAPQLSFDSDPLHTKNASTEAMTTLADLMGNPLTNPYSADIMVAKGEDAEALAARLRKLPLAGEVLTLASFVPEDQPEKLALIADAAGLLAATLAPRAPAAPVLPADLRLAATTALAQIERAATKLPPAHPLVAIGADLAKLAAAPDAVLMQADAALTRFLPMQLARLRRGLAAGPVLPADVPDEIARDWRLADGRLRVQVTAATGAQDSRGLQDFVGQVQAVAPQAGGSAVQIVETAATIITAFRTALAGAVLAIVAILALLLRRVSDVAIVLGALALSALMTVTVMVLLPLPLNFANIIALPLIQGVGVSFNVYFVMNWRAGGQRFLGTATARAVLFSALTTATAFGSLAFSAHPGTSSMGVLLLISLGCTLAVSLLCIPALLAGLRR